ncbi:SWI-SNF complex subunit [Lojkania enalia]|uniref:SWI-SNF complex subunit n=1 Tax=Lojkania enalia TaxID=147567 RepID=A0A9P4N0X9_9PLEO|nr:SWI-SNF complex subunit [Didymosphaeria enalia]
MIRRTDLEQMFRKPAPLVQHTQQIPQNYAQNHHLQAQQRAEQERREKMRRIAMNPTDKNIPDGVEEVCIGDGVARYKQLRDVERTLDATMMRKKLEISDSVHHSRARRYGTMRIWISNTAENQPWQSSGMDVEAFDFESGTSATYRVKIQGRLIDDGDDLGLGDEDEEQKHPDVMEEDGTEQKEKEPASKLKVFSQCFSSIIIDFDRAKSLQPDNFTQIEWKRPEAANPGSKEANFSQLEFERKGDENINITVNLQRLHVPDRYRLSKPLAELLDTDEEDRAGVMMGIWEYARSHHLQQEDDERKFTCDAKLRAIFNTDNFYFPSLPQHLKLHLTALPPVQLSYTIRVDKDYISPPPDSGIPPSQPTIYDVQIQLDDPLQPLVYDLLRPKNSIETLQHIHNIDEQIVLLMGAISQSKAKHAFFTSMAKDPVAFVKRWLSSQKRDLEVILGEASRGGGEDASGEEWRRGGPDSVWGSETARESVALWLARSSIKGN